MINYNTIKKVFTNLINLNNKNKIKSIDELGYCKNMVVNSNPKIYKDTELTHTPYELSVLISTADNSITFLYNYPKKKLVINLLVSNPYTNDIKDIASFNLYPQSEDQLIDIYNNVVTLFKEK